MPDLLLILLFLLRIGSLYSEIPLPVDAQFHGQCALCRLSGHVLVVVRSAWNLAGFAVPLMKHVEGVDLGSGHAHAPAEQGFDEFVNKHEQAVTRIVVAYLTTYSDLQGTASPQPVALCVVPLFLVRQNIQPHQQIVRNRPKNLHAVHGSSARGTLKVSSSAGPSRADTSSPSIS